MIALLNNVFTPNEIKYLIAISFNGTDFKPSQSFIQEFTGLIPPRIAEVRKHLIKLGVIYIEPHANSDGSDCIHVNMSVIQHLYEQKVGKDEEQTEKNVQQITKNVTNSEPINYENRNKFAADNYENRNKFAADNYENRNDSITKFVTKSPKNVTKFVSITDKGTDKKQINKFDGKNNSGKGNSPANVIDNLDVELQHELMSYINANPGLEIVLSEFYGNQNFDLEKLVNCLKVIDVQRKGYEFIGHKNNTDLFRQIILTESGAISEEV